METQTERMIVDDALKDIISFKSEEIVGQIESLLTIKKTQFKEGKSPQKVLPKIHKRLRENLFKLLMVIIENETFITLSEYMRKSI